MASHRYSFHCQGLIAAVVYKRVATGTWSYCQLTKIDNYYHLLSYSIPSVFFLYSVNNVARPDICNKFVRVPSEHAT